MKTGRIIVAGLVAGVATSLSGVAFADSISPESYTDTLAVGESVTIEKTVVVNEGSPTDARIDVHFLIDTSGSMGAQVNAAKAAATNLFNSLNDDFGDVQASVGVFSEGASLTDPDIRGRAIIGDLTSDAATFQANVNLVTRSNPDGGGDFPESGWTGMALAGDNLSWRSGSSRFMFVFTDASAKGDLAGAQATVDANDINVVALSYGSLSTITSSYATPFGGDAFAATTSADGIIADVTEGITAGFANYDEVSVSDLGNGLPGIGVSVVCTGANIGTCDGDTATGDFDRSEDRTFTFDVTFERLAEGEITFETYALVDGGIVATEIDTFLDGDRVDPIPLPAAAWLMLTGLGAMGVMSRRRR
jgi:hypothetical protein